MDKRFWVAALICLNLVLLTGILLLTYSPPVAYAQEAGLHGNYLIVSGSIQSDFDGLYVVDLKTKRLHAFYYERARDQLLYAGDRDLEADFRNRE